MKKQDRLKTLKDKKLTFPYYDWEKGNVYYNQQDYDLKAPNNIDWENISQDVLNQANLDYKLGFKVDKKGNVIRNKYNHTPIKEDLKNTFTSEALYDNYKKSKTTINKGTSFKKNSSLSNAVSALETVVGSLQDSVDFNNQNIVNQRNIKAKQRYLQEQLDKKEYIDEQKELGGLFLNSAALASSLAAMGSQIGSAVYNNKASNLLFTQGYNSGITNPKYINYRNISNNLDKAYNIADGINFPLDIAQFVTSDGEKEKLYNGVQLGLSGIKYIPVNNPTLHLIKPTTSFIGNALEPLNLLFANGGYIPSTSIKNRITNWEGSSMYKPAPDTKRVNRSFEEERRDFINALPKKALNDLSQESLDALYSYSYNVGAGNFKKRVVPILSKYLDGKATAEEVARSMYATRDNQLRGLQKRRRFERNAFYKGATGKNLQGEAYNDLTPLQQQNPFTFKSINSRNINSQLNNSPIENVNNIAQYVSPQTFIETIQKQVKEANYGDNFIQNVNSNDSYLNSIYNSSLNEEKQNINNEIANNEVNKFLSLLDDTSSNYQNNNDNNLFAEGGNTYTVKKGDTLWGIAKRNNISLKDLVKVNPQIEDINKIYPEDIINFPTNKSSSNFNSAFDSISSQKDSNNQINFNKRISSFSNKEDVGYDIEDVQNIFQSNETDTADIKKLKELKASGQWDKRYDKIPRQYASLLDDYGSIPIIKNPNTGLFQPLERTTPTYTVTFPNLKRIKQEIKDLEEAQKKYEENVSTDDENLLKTLGENLYKARTKVLNNYTQFSSEKLGDEINQKVSSLGITSDDINNAKFEYLKNKQNRSTEEDEEFTKLANKKVKDRYNELTNEYNQFAYDNLFRNSVRGIGSYAAYTSSGVIPFLTNLGAAVLPNNSFTNNKYVQNFINDFNNPANGIINTGGEIAHSLGVDDDIVNASEAGLNIAANLVLSGGKSLISPRQIKTAEELSQLSRLQRAKEYARNIVSPNYGNAKNLAFTSGVLGGVTGTQQLLKSQGYDNAALALQLGSGALLMLPQYRNILNQQASNLYKTTKILNTATAATLPYAGIYGASKELGMNDEDAAMTAGYLSNVTNLPFFHRITNPIDKVLESGFTHSGGTTGGADSVKAVALNYAYSYPKLTQRFSSFLNPLLTKIGINPNIMTRPEGFGEIIYNGRDTLGDNLMAVDRTHPANVQHGSNEGTKYNTVDGIEGTIPSRKETTKTINKMQYDFYNGHQESTAHMPVPLLSVKAGTMRVPEGKTAIFDDGKVVNTPLKPGALDYDSTKGKAVTQVNLKTTNDSQLTKKFLSDRQGERLQNYSEVYDNMTSQGYTLDSSSEHSYFNSDKARSLGTGERQFINQQNQVYSRTLKATPNTNGAIMKINVWRHPSGDPSKNVITVAITDRFAAGVSKGRVQYENANTSAIQEQYRRENNFTNKQEFIDRHALPLKQNNEGYSAKELSSMIDSVVEELNGFSTLKSFKGNKLVERSIFDLQENPSQTAKQDFKTFFESKVKDTIQSKIKAFNEKIEYYEKQGKIHQVEKYQQLKQEYLQNPTLTKTEATALQNEIYKTINQNISKNATLFNKKGIDGTTVRKVTEALGAKVIVDNGVEVYPQEYLQQHKEDLQKAYQYFGRNEFRFNVDELPLEYQKQINKAVKEGKITLTPYTDKRGNKKEGVVANMKELYEADIPLNLDVFSKNTSSNNNAAMRDNFVEVAELLKHIN